MRPQGSAYRADIDGLRACAVVPVVLFHAFPDRMPGGFIGVDVFFVISGFLITSIIAARQEGAGFSLRDFYAARVRRIFPALILVLVASLAAGGVLMSTRAFAELGRHTIGAVLFAANIVFWRGVDYFGPVAIEQPLLHLWSLGVEEQFYLVWPVILIAAWRFRWPRVRIAAALALVSFGYCLWVSANDPAAAFYLPFGRAWELMLGALLALVRPVMPSRVGHAASIIGLALLGAGVLLIAEGQPYPGWRALVPCGAAALLIAAGPRALVNRHLLSLHLLVGIGLISYPLYLWHWPLLSFATIADFGDLPSERARAVLVIAAFALAAATYLAVERPAAVRRHLTPYRLAALMALVGVAGIWCLTGAPGRTTSRDPANAFIDRYENLRLHGLAAPYRFDCDFYDSVTKSKRAQIAAACLEPGPKATAFLWGDSHAQALSPGLRAILPRGVALAQIATSGCAPALTGAGQAAGPGNACPTGNAAALAAIDRLRPDIVFLAQNSGHENTDWDQLADRLRRSGVRHVVLIGPVPEWHPGLPKLFARRYLGTAARRSLDGVLPENLRTDQLLRARYGHSTSIVYVSLIDQLCEPAGCLMKVPGSDGLMAVDYGHFTPAASVFVGRRIVAPALRRHRIFDDAAATPAR